MISDPENSNYRIERFCKTKLKDLEVLFQAVYGTPPPPGHFEKKYDTSFTGVEYIGYIAYNPQDMAIAYYGVIPCFIQQEATLLLSAQSGDTMTHPGFRQKGLFVTLSRLTFALCQQAGIRLIVGFPNQNFYNAILKKDLGWIIAAPMECFIIPVTPWPFALLARRWRPLKRLYLTYTRFILQKYTLREKGLPASGMSDGYGGVYRDDSYLQYKTCTPTRVIQAGNGKAWVRTKDQLIIGDLAVTDPDFDKTIGALKKIAARLGIRQLMFHSSPGTRVHGLFKARYTASRSFPVIFQDLGAGLDWNALKFTFADIDIF